MRSAPGQLLHLDMDARVRTLELGHELCDHLAFAAHRPEADDIRIVVACAASRHEEKHGDEERPSGGTPPTTAQSAFYLTDAVSQPPSKPARVRPRCTYGFLRITSQIMPLR